MLQTLVLFSGAGLVPIGCVVVFKVVTAARQEPDVAGCVVAIGLVAYGVFLTGAGIVLMFWAAGDV